MQSLKNKRITVTGGGGFLGSWVVKELKRQGVQDVFVPRSRHYDLRSKSACEHLAKRSDYIIHLAAYVGGIGLNQKYPGRLFYDNALMGIQLMEAARKEGVEKMLITGTACSYPKNTPVPFREQNFWDGYPEEVTGMYGMAKKMLLVQAQAYRQEYGFNCTYLIPTNLYGPGDNDDPDSGHVIPSLIRRMVEAHQKKSPQFVVWGTGRATREFLYAQDAAHGIIQALKHYNKSDPINLGSGQETSIKYLVKLLKKNIGYRGKIVWDIAKPDGQKRRSMNTAQAHRAFRFRATTSLEEGLKKTVAAYLEKITK